MDKRAIDGRYGLQSGDKRMAKDLKNETERRND